MGFVDVGQGAAAIVFLILYLGLGVALVWSFMTRRPVRRFVGLSIFDAIRVGSQIAGIGFAVASYSNFNWLIAYFVLGAEGYFALILTALYVLIGYQASHFGSSWLHRPITKEEEPSRLKRRLHQFSQPAAIFHQMLIPANILTIYGGTSQSAGDGVDYASNPKVTRGRTLRSVGQALFLVLTLLFLGFVVATMRRAHQKRTNLTPLWYLLATGPLFIVRGVFGILSSALTSLSYYNPANYDANGLSSRVLIVDYVCGTAMEFIAASLILSAAVMLSHRKGEAPQEPVAEPEAGPEGDIKQVESA